MMSFANRRRFAGSLQDFRDRIAAGTPNRRTPFVLGILDRFLAAQNKSRAAQTTTTPAEPAGGPAAGPLSNNDPRSLTDPRTRSTVSKTLLGQ